MNETITRNEVMNDGKTIHLYFNGLVGLYVAYGISAFLLDKVTTVSPSYSWEMQMPVVVINVAHLNEMKKRLTLTRQGQAYCCLQADISVAEDEFCEWAGQLRERGNRQRAHSIIAAKDN